MQQLNTHQTNGKANVDRFHFVPLYIQVRNLLGEQIAAGKWKTYQQLPDEATLAKELGISQGTARKALDALEQDGILTRRQGKGTFVTDKQANDERRKLACVRKSLFVIKEAVREAGQNTTPKLQSSLQTHIAEALFSAGYSGDAAG
jgi:DNA-binding GntR family transcriptional regulator